MEVMILALTILTLIIWIWLLIFRGQFWRCDQFLDRETPVLESYPPVCVVIPARNEADLLPISLRSLLLQNYPGHFAVILVDDQSEDHTAEIAHQIAAELGKKDKLKVICSQPLPSGWTGKLWALEQGIKEANNLIPCPDYIVLSDADIDHNLNNLLQLVTKSESEKIALTSLMVLLRCESFWEKLLIPSFIFFFQKLYPFRWVNNPKNSLAAAAGGCILIRRETLIDIGGIQVLKDALIDDCTLAKVVKSHPKTERIWLGLTKDTKSLRPYPSLKTIWDLVARTAYTQLNYSPLLLLGTIFGMFLVYLMPIVGLIIGLLLNNYLIFLLGFITYFLMTISYFPSVKLYQCSPFFACLLPIIAVLYTLMTIDSAIRHWQGKGGAWKGRVY
jgi:hopene-associated glycosyltransferase HpnB